MSVFHSHSKKFNLTFIGFFKVCFFFGETDFDLSIQVARAT